MKEKLLSSLKTMYKNLGFGDKAFDGVAEFLSKTVTQEADIETAISGVEPLLKAFQGDVDKIRNEKAELQRKLAELEKNNPKPGDPPLPPAGDPNEPAWFKQYREKQEAEATALKQKIEGFEAKEKFTSLQGKLKAKLSEKKIPEAFWAKRNISIDSEEQLDQITSELEADYTAFRQELVNSGVMIDRPQGSEGGTKEGAALAKSIAEKRNTNASDGLKGKDI